jgi:hypothetical protein
MKPVSADNILRVVPASLVGHAAHIDSVAAAVDTAKQAGEAVRVDAQAYGYLCVLVPVLLDILQRLVVGGIDAAVNSLHDTGERVRIAAQAYQDTDQANQAVLDQVRTGR